MIITVTMNPAIDKTVEIEQFIHGGLNRIGTPISDAGGKGINVSKTIKALGGDTLAMGFLGERGSQIILDCLRSEGIEHDFVLVSGATRTNMKLMEKDGTLTELNEQGMTVSEEKIEELIAGLESYAAEDTLFVLAGSIPAGVDAKIYQRITKAVKKKGAKVFVDADGALLVEALEAVPSIIKPNHVELAEYFGCTGEVDEVKLIEYGKALLEKGIETIAISRGSKGALFLTKDSAYRVLGLKVEAHSTVGAGDAMVAALSFAISQKMSWEESIKLSIASSAGAVTTKGTKPPSKELVEELKNQVVLEKL